MRGMILGHDHPVLSNVLIGAVLFGGMIGLTMLGRQRGRKLMANLPEGLPGLGTIEGALFALLGLLVALTFSGATDRFQERKALILREANAVSTAYARLDLLPDEVRKELQAGFRSYLGLRLDAYRKTSSLEGMEQELRASAAAGAELWRIAARACRRPESTAFTTVVLPALNEMLDVAADRTAALRKHPPLVVYAFLFALSLICAFLAGFSMARGAVISKTHVVVFALMISLTICVTLDLEHPRIGLITLGSADELLRQTLESMK
jgi:hypothetical protein